MADKVANYLHKNGLNYMHYWISYDKFKRFFSL